jgi:hypothetical protein
MSDNIGLLLSRFDTEEPFFKEGIPLEHAANNPRPKEDEGPEHYDFDGGDENSLPEQRWGIVAPEGKAGDRLLSLVAPLQQHREEQQGIDKGKAWIRRVPPNMGDQEADDWLDQVWKDEDVPKRDRPHYLLLLGDADLVSWELQKKLTSCAFTGRLAFAAGEGYEAYVAKVLASERETAEEGARALFYCVHGDPATDEGYRGLLRPTVEAAEEAQLLGAFNATQIVEVGGGSNVQIDDFLRAAGERQPTMMFTVSHGAGMPNSGWGSVEKQRSFQGAMCFGGGQKLTYDMVANRAFVPNGIWFFFACFGAGTPSSSSYEVWLDQLKGIGEYRGTIAELYASLPTEGEKPFVAALPQAALANPNGPLAVMGHVDLAWTYGFQEYGDKGKRNRTSRFTDVFRSLVDGKRAGLGLDALRSTFNTTNSALNTIYQKEERAKKKNLPVDDDKASKRKKANLWMLREDLSAYVLLGDPASRLNIASPNHAAVQTVLASASISAASIATSPASAAVQAFAAPVAQQASKVKKLPDIDAMEKALLLVLTEDTTAKRTAEKLGVERDDVQAWVTAYQTGGREALKKL